MTDLLIYKHRPDSSGGGHAYYELIDRIADTDDSDSGLETHVARSALTPGTHRFVTRYDDASEETVWHYEIFVPAPVQTPAPTIRRV